MGETYVAYSNEDLFQYLKDNGDLILPKKYSTLEIDGRLISSFGSIRRIFCSLFIRRETILENFGQLEYVDGDVWIQYPSSFKPRLNSLGKLKTVTGELSLNEGVIDLGDLEEVRGSAKFVNSKIKSLGKLKSVGENLSLHKSIKEILIIDDIKVQGKVLFREKSSLFHNHEYQKLGKYVTDSGLVPWPKSYLYSWTSVEWEFEKKRKVKVFYEKVFKPMFLNGTPVDTLGFETYAFALLFDLMQNLKNDYSTEVYDNYLFELGHHYPSTKGYILSFTSEELIKEGKYELAWKVFLENGNSLNLLGLFEWEQRLGRSLLNERMLNQLIPKSFLTILGRENYSEVFRQYDRILESILTHTEKSIFGFSRKIKIPFWELFFKSEESDTLFHSLTYYKNLIQDIELVDQMLKLDDSINSYDITITNDIPVYKNKYMEGNAHPLTSHLVEKVILRFIKNIMRQAEDEFRLSIGVPKIGEGGIWKSESELFELIKNSFTDEEIIQQASPYWLGRQRFDIYFPLRNIAVEYQGEQHYSPIEFFGGEDEFNKRQKLDDRKKNLCLEYDCDLIYVDEGYDRSRLVEKIQGIIRTKTILKIPTDVRKSKIPTRRVNVERVETDVEIFDCKSQTKITFQYLKTLHPKVSPNYFIERESLYGRYILNSKRENSIVLQGWKNIKDITTGEITRFNKKGFADHVGANQNAVWAFFNGKQKVFYRKYVIVN